MYEVLDWGGGSLLLLASACWLIAGIKYMVDYLITEYIG